MLSLLFISYSTLLRRRTMFHQCLLLITFVERIYVYYRDIDIDAIVMRYIV